MKYIAPFDISLLDALQQIFPKNSKNSLKSLCAKGRVFVEGQIVYQIHFLVKKGALVEIGSKTRFLEGGVQLLYEDEHLIVVDKPVGLLSVATDYEKGETLHALLKRLCRPKNVIAVHRLDRETSGVMVFALSPLAKEKLKALFSTHEIRREYLAIVEGKLSAHSGTWRSYLYEDAAYHVHKTSDETRGKLAVTHYAVEKETKQFSLVKLSLETGRKNQIRVQCQIAGHPIVGDQKYGSMKNPIQRLCLHAHLLELKHPASSKLLKFISPCPAEFSKLIQ